jgi:hypothetical protein
MSKRLELTGQKFGRLTVVEFAYSNRDSRSYWKCKCDCGIKKNIRGKDLKNNKIISCGCYKRENTSKIMSRHKLCGTPFYHVWRAMKSRCEYSKNISYYNYGKRGIKVCDRWKEFKNFYDDMFLSYLEHKKVNNYTSLERKNNNGNYELSNCIWADRKIQNNNSSQNHLITYNGKTLNLSQWAEKIGISNIVLTSRLNKHKWSIERALTTPKCLKGFQKGHPSFK